MHYVPFLPLLELPHTQVTVELRGSFLAHGLTDSDYQSVSLSELVAFALRSSSNYWLGLAVRWLEDGFPVDETIAQACDEMISAKRGSQADRHAAFRMIRRWEKDREPECEQGAPSNGG
jgi:hypothetical protein